MPEKPGFGTFVAQGKDLVTLLRDLALLVLVVLLVVFPGQLNAILDNAGFEEGSFAGFKWRSRLVASDDALNDARATIADLQAQLDKTSKALAQALARVDDPALNTQAASLEQENQGVKSEASRVTAAVRSTIAANASLVDKAVAGEPGGGWVVVIGGDRSLDAAKFEVGVAARQLGIPNASIYLRDGSYRTVAVVGTKAEADAVRARAQARRPDAYVVRMSSWCPRPETRAGFNECIRQ